MTLSDIQSKAHLHICILSFYMYFSFHSSHRSYRINKCSQQMSASTGSLLELSINVNGNHRIRVGVRNSDRGATIGLHGDRFTGASALLQIARDHITVLTLRQTCL